VSGVDLSTVHLQLQVTELRVVHQAAQVGGQSGQRHLERKHGGQNVDLKLRKKGCNEESCVSRRHQIFDRKTTDEMRGLTERWPPRSGDRAVVSLLGSGRKPLARSSAGSSDSSRTKPLRRGFEI